MNSWRDSGKWNRWLAGVECPICQAVRDEEAIAELETVRVLMPEDGPVRGYAWLPFRRHVIELHELTEAEGIAFQRDLRRISAAFASVTGAVKLNWEIHGNTVPHLHVHLFPRYPGDRFEGRPIAPREVTHSIYGAGELTALAQRIREALADV